MQAITTKFAAPTNTRGSRIIAKAAASSLTVCYDCRLNLDENHRAAAKALVKKLGWTGPNYGELVSGCDYKGDYVHVMTKAVSTLRALTRAVVRNERDDTNPYSRPVVKDALDALADVAGVYDHLSVDLG